MTAMCVCVCVSDTQTAIQWELNVYVIAVLRKPSLSFAWRPLHIEQMANIFELRLYWIPYECIYIYTFFLCFSSIHILYRSRNL